MTQTNQIDGWRERATVSVETAGAILGISRASAYAAVGADELPVIRVGRRLLVPTARLRVLLGEIVQNDHDPAANRVVGKVGDGDAQQQV
jgi:hypothetical protein